MSKLQEKIKKLDDLNAKARSLTAKITDGTISVEERATITTLTGDIDTLMGEIAQEQADLKHVERFAPLGATTKAPKDEIDAVKHYSITRSAQYVNGTIKDADMGSELEVDQEARRIARACNLPLTGKGLAVTDAVINQSQARSTYGTAADAGNLGQQQTLPYMEGYRKKLFADQLGARMMLGLTGVAKLPVGDTLVSSGWVAENGAIPTLAGNVRKHDLTPNLVGAKVTQTWHLGAQASPEVDRYLLDLLFTGEANAINASILTTVANGPKGLLDAAYGADTDISGVNGSAVSRSIILSMINAAATKDADGATPKWVVSPALRGVLQNLPVDPGSGLFVWPPDAPNMLMGFDAHVSSHVPSAATKGSGTGLKVAAFGHWDQLVMANWAVRELIVDRVSSDAGVVTKLLSFWDFAYANPKAFSVAYFT